MTKKLNWRLKTLPTVEEINSLIKTEIISKEEAKQLLFNEGVDTKELKEEIRFLRQIIEKMAENGKVTEIIRTIEAPYKRYDWFNPYQIWYSDCSSITDIATSGTSGNYSISDIETF